MFFQPIWLSHKQKTSKVFVGSNLFNFSDAAGPYEVFVSQVRQDRPGVGEWQRVGDITKKEIPHRGNVRDALDLQFQDTFYKISLQVSLFLIIFIILMLIFPL